MRYSTSSPGARRQPAEAMPVGTITGWPGLGGDDDSLTGGVRVFEPCGIRRIGRRTCFELAYMPCPWPKSSGPGDRPRGTAQAVTRRLLVGCQLGGRRADALRLVITLAVSRRSRSRTRF